MDLAELPKWGRGQFISTYAIGRLTIELIDEAF
jgi:hypothetical protein